MDNTMTKIRKILKVKRTQTNKSLNNISRDSNYKMWSELKTKYTYCKKELGEENKNKTKFSPDSAKNRDMSIDLFSLASYL